MVGPCVSVEGRGRWSASLNMSVYAASAGTSLLSQPMRSIGVSQRMSLASDHIIVPAAGQSGCFQSVVTD